MTQLAPFFYQQFLDVNGNPLAGGKIHSYAAGTTTPLATYVDSTGGTPNTNPIILDSSGRGQIWLGTLAYKFVIADSTDVVLATVDNISYINPGSIVASMIANGAVGSAQIAAGGVLTANIGDLQVTAAKIANGTITSTQIADASITGSKIANGTLTQANFSTALLGLSLGATQVQFYTFTVASASATAGATYSNNGSIFTVLTTLAAGTTLITSSNGVPTGGSTNLVLVSGTGDMTISATSNTNTGTYNWTVPTGVTRIIVESCGGGGGGAGSGGVTGSGNGGSGAEKNLTIIQNLVASTVIPIVVGDKGTGGAVSTAGNAGTNTSFNGVVVGLGADGGQEGRYGNQFSQFSGAFNLGGVGTDAGAGAAGIQGASSSNFAGGGGGAGGGTSGGFAFWGGGGGGASDYAAGGAGGSGSGTTQAGFPAFGNGAGGGGAGWWNSGGQTGGEGSPGVLIIYY